MLAFSAYEGRRKALSLVAASGIIGSKSCMEQVCVLALKLSMVSLWATSRVMMLRFFSGYDKNYKLRSSSAVKSSS